MSALCIHSLPKECLILIFQNLEKKEVARAEQVCLIWNKTISEYSWRRLFSNFYPMQSFISNPKKLIIILHPLPRIKRRPETKICAHLNYLDNVPVIRECIDVYRHINYNINALKSINIYDMDNDDWRRVASVTVILSMGILKFVV